MSWLSEWSHGLSGNLDVMFDLIQIRERTRPEKVWGKFRAVSSGIGFAIPVTKWEVRLDTALLAQLELSLSPLTT